VRHASTWSESRGARGRRAGAFSSAGFYQTDFGYAARTGYGENLLASQYAMDIENARAYALQFHDDAAKNPRFSEVSSKDCL
jgi:hypothetical protein